VRRKRITIYLVRVTLLVAAAFGLTVASGSAQAVLRSFDQDTVGSVPAGFSFAAARLATGGKWLVRADGADRYMVHLSEPAAGDGFAIAVLDAMPPIELRLSARIKLAEGARAGGLVWRYQNPENFYAVSLDLAAQDVALYRVARGNRIRLEIEDDLELDPNAWHSIRVEHEEGRVRVALGGIGVIRARDRAVDEGVGRAGVWSAGTATTWFDDVQVQPADNNDAEGRRRETPGR
jgi:hypothetical protein